MIIRRGENDERTAVVSGRQLSTPCGTQLGAVVVKYDITERKRGERELAAAKIAAEAANRAKSEFLAT